MSKKNTFHESWFKVADLLPQIHVSLKICRQKYRGRIWYVVQDPGSNQFFRINRPAYQFLAYLDGKRTVDTAWNICYEEYGDEAPTQGEAITLLGQLYSSNLLQGDVPADSENLLKRHKKRQKREATAYMKGILFARIPLLNPDSFLDKWTFLFGPVFSRTGYLLGVLLIASGLTFVFNNFDSLAAESADSLSFSNLPWLYLMFALTKLLHEFGHGFACKYYGRKTMTGGTVNTMGVALLLLTPVPYVDASSSWAFKNKWMRVAVAGAGMYIELLTASAAAIIWSFTSAGDAVHILAFNVMLISSITTILFNGNPLLRYDAYYMLADAFEIPNLAGRSKLHMKYLYRKFIFGVRSAVSPAYDRLESAFMFIYAILAEAYKVLIYVSIIFILSELNPALGLIGVFLYLIIALGVPGIKLMRYLFTAPELQRTRLRAGLISCIMIISIFWLVAGLKIKDRVVVEGVIEPVDLTQVHVQSEGFVQSHLLRQHLVIAQKTEIFKAENPQIRAEIVETEAEMARLRILIRSYAGKDPARKAIHLNSLQALEKKTELLKSELSELIVKAPLSGLYIPEADHDMSGKFMHKGSRLGIIVSQDRLIIRSVIDQDTVRILDDAEDRVKYRLRGTPEFTYNAAVKTRRQAGLSKLPSAALGYSGGGEIDVKQSQTGTETKEFFFEIVIEPEEEPWNLKPGQIVAVRFEMKDKTVFELLQGFVNRLLLKRFRI